jgi:hypothetical protein
MAGGQNDQRYGGTATWDALRRRTYERDEYTCQRCGRQSGPDGDADFPVHAHHVVPLSVGGSTRLRNLVTLCPPCHGVQHPDNDEFDDVRPAAPSLPDDEAAQSVAYYRPVRRQRERRVVNDWLRRATLNGRTSTDGSARCFRCLRALEWDRTGETVGWWHKISDDPTGTVRPTQTVPVCRACRAVVDPGDGVERDERANAPMGAHPNAHGTVADRRPALTLGESTHLGIYYWLWSPHRRVATLLVAVVILGVAHATVVDGLGLAAAVAALVGARLATYVHCRVRHGGSTDDVVGFVESAVPSDVHVR